MQPLIEALEPKLHDDHRGTLIAFAKAVHEVLQGGDGAQGATLELQAGMEEVRAIGMSGGKGGGGGGDAAPPPPEPPAQEAEAAPSPQKAVKKRVKKAAD